MASSMSAMTPAATALHEKSKCGQLLVCLHQTTKQTPASTKHAPAFIDQTMVIQLIGCPCLVGTICQLFLGPRSNQAHRSTTGIFSCIRGSRRCPGRSYNYLPPQQPCVASHPRELSRYFSLLIQV